MRTGWARAEPIAEHGLPGSLALVVFKLKRRKEPPAEVSNGAGPGDVPTDGHAAVQLARELSPNVVLMDVSMPDLNGIEATREIVRESPGPRVIALSMHSAKRYVREIFRAGASGYLLKDCEFDGLVETIRLIAEGQTYISPSISQIVVESYMRNTSEDTESAFSVLTQREREVLQLMAEGNSTKQIAMRLFISPKTVEAHRLRIMNKLDIDNVARLTKYAIQEGLTPPEPCLLPVHPSRPAAPPAGGPAHESHANPSSEPMPAGCYAYGFAQACLAGKSSMSARRRHGAPFHSSQDGTGKGGVKQSCRVASSKPKALTMVRGPGKPPSPSSEDCV